VLAPENFALPSTSAQSEMWMNQFGEMAARCHHLYRQADTGTSSKERSGFATVIIAVVDIATILLESPYDGVGQRRACANQQKRRCRRAGHVENRQDEGRSGELAQKPPSVCEANKTTIGTSRPYLLQRRRLDIGALREWYFVFPKSFQKPSNFFSSTEPRVN
jgi:hypothetical protein